MKKRKHIQY